MRLVRSLDGADWRIKPHLGLEGALRAAERPGESGAGWLPASVPGSILDDLWRAGEVPDPYRERNSLLMEWVPERAWTYRRSFSLDGAVGARRAILRFDGVDHACHVFVDGTLLARHEGMFVPFEVELGERFGAGEHELAVVVEPAPASEPQMGRTSRVRVHKSRMGYGWDFCPRLIHQGIWQPVTLEIADAVRIVDVWAKAELSADFGEAKVRVQIRLDCREAMPVRIEADLQGGSTAKAALELDASAGTSEAVLELDVASPALWWPNGYGAPALHRLTVRAIGPEGFLDERDVPVGFRRIEILANDGAPAGARPYTFAINGRRIPITGWNWVPIDALYGVPRPARLAHLLRLAANANVNLLRVWGGGLIETEAFYDACDRLGILVWQEFSQSSSGVESTPASDPAYVEMMVREAEAIIPLRRNHPSLAVWCGGNELEDEAGPLDERSPVLAALDGVVGRLDPGRAWLPTSPTGPRFHNRLDVIADDPDGLHDVHGPWEHQGLRGQYELYDRGTSLFNSEFGVEGMTNRRVHEATISPERRQPPTRANPVYRHLGDWWINEPLVQEAFGGRLRGVEDLRRASQFLQAEGLRYAVEANRRRWPRNSGSIPWQFNESYPNAWCTSAVDHRGDPKRAYWAIARAYSPVHVCAQFERAALGDSTALPISVWAWSLDPSLRRGVVEWRVLTVDGSSVEEHADAVDLSGGRPVRAGGRTTVELRVRPSFFFLDLRLADGAGRVRGSNRYLFSGSDDFGGLLDLPRASVDIAVREAAGGSQLDIRHTTGPAAIGLFVEDARSIESAGWAELEDNGFDVLPGERRSVGLRWADAPDEGRCLRISGWNISETLVPAAV